MDLVVSLISVFIVVVVIVFCDIKLCEYINNRRSVYVFFDGDFIHFDTLKDAKSHFHDDNFIYFFTFKHKQKNHIKK